MTNDNVASNHDSPTHTYSSDDQTQTSFLSRGSKDPRISVPYRSKAVTFSMFMIDTISDHHHTRRNLHDPTSLIFSYLYSSNMI